MPTEIKGYRAAGALFLLSAILTYVTGSEVSFAQAALGVVLLIVNETTKADLLRFVVFAWVLFAVGVVLVAAISQAVFLPVVPMLLFAGGIVGLMLEGISQSQVLVCSVVSLAGLALSFLI